ncbi:MAG: hypothetical protein AAGB48_06645 [Planctomycetota bacterium]
MAVVASAGCAPRQAEGWYGHSLATALKYTETYYPLIRGGLENETEVRARETIRLLQTGVFELNFIGSNRAEKRRTDEDWEALSVALADAYTSIEVAFAEPVESLALGVESPPVAEAMRRVVAIRERFGGGPLEGTPITIIRP